MRSRKECSLIVREDKGCRTFLVSLHHSLVRPPSERSQWPTVKTIEPNRSVSWATWRTRRHSFIWDLGELQPARSNEWRPDDILTPRYLTQSYGQKSKHRQKCKISSAIKNLDPCRVSRKVVSFYWTELRIRNHVFPPGHHEIPRNILLPPALLFFPAINFISWKLFFQKEWVQ